MVASQSMTTKKPNKNQEVHSIAVRAHKSLWAEFRRVMERESLPTYATAVRAMMKAAVDRGRIR